MRGCGATLIGSRVTGVRVTPISGALVGRGWYVGLYLGAVTGKAVSGGGGGSGGGGSALVAKGTDSALVGAVGVTEDVTSSTAAVRTAEHQQHARHHDRGHGGGRRDHRRHRLLGAIPRRWCRCEFPGVVVERVEVATVGGKVIGIRLVIPEVVVRFIPQIVTRILRRGIELPRRLDLGDVVIAGQPVGVGPVVPEVVEVPRGFAFNHIQMLTPVPGQMRARW